MNFSKGGKYDGGHLPDPLRKFWNSDVIPYKEIIPFLDVLRTKRRIEFKCKICKRITSMQFNKMRRRKICGAEPICAKCAIGYATTSNEWRNSNSKAQYVAQNRPDVLEKSFRS
jgi:hypothetical protein